MAVPTYVAASTLVAAASGTTIAATAPAGKANSDLLVLGACANTGDTISTPSGWNVLVTAVNNANFSYGWYWRIADGTGADTPTVTFSVAGSTTNGHYCRTWAFRGNDTTAPTEGVSNAAQNIAAPVSGAVTTTGADRLLVTLLMVDDDNTWASGMPPAGYTNCGPILSSATGGDCMTDGIYIARATAGTQAAVTIGTMSAIDQSHRVSFAVVPTADVTVTGSQAVETDTANAGTRVVVITGTRATETDTANAGSIVLGVSVTGTRATETDTANAGSVVLGVSVTGTKATETDTGQAGAALVATTGQRATETDTGRAGTPLVVVTGTRATETDTGRAGTSVVTVTVTGSRATEADTGANGAPLVLTTGTRATETDTAQAGSSSTGGGSFTYSGARATVTCTAFAGSSTIPGTYQIQGRRLVRL